MAKATRMDEAAVEVGKRYAFTYEGKELEGVVIKVAHDEATVKLDSGYNVVLPRTGARAAGEQKEKPTKHVPHTVKNPKLPTITILHTGGTVASRVDYSTGAVIAQFSPDEIISLYPELTRIANVRSRLVSNIQSEMMRFGHWNLLARAVAEEREAGVDGIIVTHGTDILHLSGAALLFALEGLDVPVLLVGSQRSSDRPSSDAVSNLLCAATFIAQHGKRFSTVGICMHESIEKDDCVVLPAARCRKMHTSRRDAFKCINDIPFARITYPGLKVEQLRDYPPASTAKFAVRPFREDLKVGMLRMRPQLWLEELQTYEKFDGLVLELLGIGHAPTMVTDALNPQHAAILAEIQMLASHMPVVAAPQTIFGRIDMNVYSPGRQLLEAGVLGNGLDLTPETAFVKLAWLLSNVPRKDIPKRYHENLRGEQRERSETRGFPD